MSGERTYYELESYPKQGEWSLPGIYSSSRTLGEGQLVVIHDGDDFQLAIVRRTVGQLEALTNAGRMGAQPIVDMVDTAAWQAGREAAIKRRRIRQLMDEKMSDITLMDKLRKFADKDSAFKTLYDAYLDTLQDGQADEAQQALD